MVSRHRLSYLNALKYWGVNDMLNGTKHPQNEITPNKHLTSMVGGHWVSYPNGKNKSVQGEQQGIYLCSRWKCKWRVIVLILPLCY